MTEILDLRSIRTDGGTQSRANISTQTVEEYADGMREGDAFPPVTVFHDGQNYWLVDGFHRVAAARSSGATQIKADVRQGDKRAAILFSVGANASHGLRRTNEDKRRAVNVLFADDEWKEWSDREIARRCGVSNQFVSNVRPNVTVNGGQLERTYTDKHGNVSKMKTDKINRDRPKPVRTGTPYNPDLPPTSLPKPAKNTPALTSVDIEDELADFLHINLAAGHIPHILKMLRSGVNPHIVADKLAERGMYIETQGFDDFWQVYPDKKGKPVAAASYKKQITRGATHLQIMNGLKRYIENKPIDRPWLNPATFLRQERYTDEHNAAPPVESIPNHQKQVSDPARDYLKRRAQMRAN